MKLPALVSDLSAHRSGATVTLSWTNPRKTTDHLLIKGPIAAEICWQRTPDHCESVDKVQVEPGSKVDFREPLPAELQQGSPRVLRYFVELTNQRGRSAGPSNLAPIVAGTAPGPVTGLAATVRADGVALIWTAGEATPVRLHRKHLNLVAPQKTPSKGLVGSETESPDRDLFVDTGKPGNGALDRTARFGESYQYAAQRVLRVVVNGQTLELAGDLSAPIQVEVADTFPPAVPTGLEAVAVPDQKTIDLSWQPDTEGDLAGYIVYRLQEDPAANSSQTRTWVRVSGPQPVPAPAWRDTAVEAGHLYRYAVTAIDQRGHESGRSAEAHESMP